MDGRGPEVIIIEIGGGGMVIFNVYVHNASHRTAEVMVPRGKTHTLFPICKGNSAILIDFQLVHQWLKATSSC